MQRYLATAWTAAEFVACSTGFVPLLAAVRARNGDDPTHARLAISVSDVQNDALTQGALVRDVQSGGAADKAGLENGDIITKVDDDVIDGSESLIATIRGHRPGEEVTLTYVRDGKTETVKATLGSDADSQES